ncbi:hypothetical protein FA95DRAFT_1558273 [Auriscalpium vulgare]|uniref:Uncharacterized protein n=1 Tax=Auriscalpium vulgare TaxID=40419 RepID=A0ACB8RX01_9AGAM|nr:hypothetical protein FA95DRAFT_1558273 [Auriscalpium vulgare]
MAIWTPCESWGWGRIYSRMRRHPLRALLSPLPPPLLPMPLLRVSLESAGSTRYHVSVLSESFGLVPASRCTRADTWLGTVEARL